MRTLLAEVIGLFQPLPYLLGVLLAGVAAWLLRGIAPTLEVRAHGPHGQVDAELLADQVAHGAAGPQGGREAQIFGAGAVEEPLDVAGLLIGQQAPGAEGASGPLLRQRVQPPRGV